MNRNAWLLVCVIAVATGLAGCRTDGLHRRDPAPEAPTTDMMQPEGFDASAFRVVAQGEVDLVEQMIRYRALYANHLRALRDYYVENGLIDKARWSERELMDLSRVKPYKYLLSAEVPDTGYRPSESIAEADVLFDRAQALMKEGGQNVPALYYEQRMKEALATLKELLATYPTSDKVAEAAYWCGYIHKEYFPGDDLIAVRWFERACDALRRAGEVAGRCDVQLCFEALSPDHTNFVTTAQHAVDLVAAVGHPNVGLMLDVRAISTMPDGIAGTFAQFGHLAWHVHANDPSGRAPGMHGIDFGPVMAAVQSCGYGGWVSVEPFDTQPDPDTVARTAIETLRAAMT